MSDDHGMPYDPIQGQGQQASEVYLLRHLQWELAMTTDS